MALGLVTVGTPTPAEPGSEPTSTHWTAEHAPFRLTFHKGHERGRDAVTHVVATDEPARTARVTVAATSRGLRVSWRLRPATGVTQVCDKSGMPSQFFLSSHGYAVFPDTTAIGRRAFPNAVDDPPHCSTDPPPCPVALGQPDRTQLCFKTDHLDYEVYAGSPAEVVRPHSTKAGLPTMPPVRQFAPTHWRDTVDGQATVVDDVDQLLRRGIPLGTEWIDNPWETSTKLPGEGQNSRYACNGTLTFDPVQFPDPPGMAADLRDRGVALGIWISPQVRTRAAERSCPVTDYPHGSFIQTARTDEPRQLDLTNPVRYARATTEVLEELYGDEYTTLWRGGYTGTPAIVNGVWGGDPRATYDGLRLSVRRGLNSWLSGHPVWGTDTGGFNQRIDGVWPAPWGLSDLDRHDRAGWTYTPGAGPTVAANPFGGKLVAHRRNGTIRLTVTGAPAETRVMVAIRGTPRRGGDRRPPGGGVHGRCGGLDDPAGALRRCAAQARSAARHEHGDDHTVKE